MSCADHATPRQLELLALGEPPWLAQWLPDETLFSFVSRHHAWSGNVRSSDTCKRFFGHPIEGSGHDFPARLATFVLRTRGLVGDAVSILKDRTLLPYYLMFRTPDVFHREISRTVDHGLAGVKARLGILASRLGANHPLKLCPMCMSEELHVLGVPYWHRDHQLPGVWVCGTHHCPLQISEWRSGGAHRHQWALPHHAALFPVETMHVQAQDASVIALAAFSRFALKHTLTRPMDPTVLAKNLISRIRGPSPLKTSRGIDTREIAARVSPFLFALSSIRGNSALAEPQAAERAILALRRPQLTAHPLWLLVLSAALLDNPEQLAEASTAAPSNAGPVNGPCDSLRDDQRTALIGLVAQGIPPSKAAATIGVAAGTGVAWAAQAGLPIARRPKRIRDSTEMALRRLLRSGTSQMEAARATGISKSAVQEFIRSHPDLLNEWKLAKFSKKRQLERARWSEEIAVAHSQGIKSARSSLPSTYSWLFENDKEWLVSFNSKNKKVPDAPRLRINWRQRDLDLERAIHQQGVDPAANRVTRGHRDRIFRAIPEMKCQYRNLHRLPRSASALKPNLELPSQRRARPPRTERSLTVKQCIEAEATNDDRGRLL